MTTPHDQAERIERIARHLAETLPPSDRWLPAALLRRVRDPQTDLDRLLGLRGNGGRGRYLGSPIPERDKRLRALVASVDGTTTDKAQFILDRLRQQDPELQAIDRLARIPRSYRQLMRILG